MDKRRNVDRTLFIDIVENSHSKSEMVRRLKWSLNGNSFKILDELIEEYGVELVSYDPHKYHRTGKEVLCAVCNKSVYRKKHELNRSKSGKNFCSIACSNSGTKRGKSNGNYTDGSSTYRDRALRHYPHICQAADCPLEPSVVPIEMLDIHHKDRNRANNHIDNLQVLCVWCHVKITRDVV